LERDLLECIFAESFFAFQGEKLISFDCQYLYIHWPFCRNKCFYCDFTSFARCEKQAEAYHTALCEEIRAFECKSPIKTIFIGGGSPSLYPLHLLKELFALLHEKFDCSNLSEVTIEANPRDITEEKLSLWKELGINRLSLGVQMLDDEIIKSVGRVQTKKDVYQAIDLARRYFENISVDLILGLPGATSSKWRQTLEDVIAFPVRHISVYFLTLYEKTPLLEMIEKKKLTIPSEEETLEAYEETVQLLAQKGFLQYEISNFAQKGFASEHNQSYWDHVPYKGFGLGAASFTGKERIKNKESFGDYVNGKNIESCETLSDESLLLEKVMLGLRQSKKIDLRRMIYLVHSDKKEKVDRTISELKRLSLMDEDENGVCLTTRGMVLENEVVLRLLS
jgi:oxygen-independent coproporphyrinogen III oxidase